jgi:hypothetical protein
LNDRNTLVFPKSQIGFVQFVAGKIFKVLTSVATNLTKITETIEENQKCWNILLNNNILDLADNTDPYQIETDPEREKLEKEKIEKERVEKEKSKIIEKEVKDLIISSFKETSKSPSIELLLKKLKLNRSAIVQMLKRLETEKYLLTIPQTNQIYSVSPFCNYSIFSITIDKSTYYSNTPIEIFGIFQIFNKLDSLFNLVSHYSGEDIEFKLDQTLNIDNIKVIFLIKDPGRWENTFNQSVYSFIDIHEYEKYLVENKKGENDIVLSIDKVLPLSEFLYKERFSSNFSIPNENQIISFIKNLK